MIAGTRDIKLGNLQADKVYLGNTMLWYTGAIYIDTLPARLYYVLGEEIDLTGLVVKRTVTNEIIPVSELSVSGFDSSSVGIKTVNLSFLGKSLDFQVGITNLISGDNKIMLDANGKLIIL